MMKVLEERARNGGKNICYINTAKVQNSDITVKLNMIKGTHIGVASALTRKILMLSLLSYSVVTSLKVRELMVPNPVKIEPNALIIEAAKLMRDKNIGSVIVVEKRKVLGIVTERDLVRRVLAENRDLKTVKMREIMSKPVFSISPEEEVVNAAHIMRQRGIRRVVVMDKEALIGIITTNDLVGNMKRNIEELASTLYLVGRTWM